MAKLETVPARATPDNGVWSDLTQDAPLGVLPVAARKEIAGFLGANPEWDGVVCYVGEMTHWVQASAGEIVSFQSFLTLRMAQALSAGTDVSLDAVEESVARPERLAAHLRSAELSGQDGAVLGHLIGAELAAARAYWLGVDLRIIGQGPVADAYEQALRAQAAMVSHA